MGEKCPQCGGNVKVVHWSKVPDDRSTWSDKHNKVIGYRSTAAEQLAETEQYYKDGIRDDMVRAGLDPSGTVGLAQVHMMVEEIRERGRHIEHLQQQLADKERELATETQRKETAVNMMNDSEDKLTAANAVVGIAKEMHDKAGKGLLDGMTETHLYLKLGTALAEWRKLQGGDGE